MYKTLEDVNRVITLGKPDSVIDKFVDSYLTGIAIQPYLAAEAEYGALKAQDDQPDVEAVIDPETEEVISEAYSPNQIRDERTVELVAEYPYLAEEEWVRPAVSVDVDGWKVKNYVKLRQAAYPSQAVFLDAWVKNDTEALEAYRTACLAVKETYPKE